jgi:hypothetical protein
LATKETFTHQAIPINQTPGDESYYYSRMGDEIATSFNDQINASIKSTIEELPTTSLFRRSVNDFERGKKLDPNEANRLFPEVETPFTEPVSYGVAEEIANRTRERNELRSVISRGPQGFLPGAARLGSSLVINMLDPVNIGASLLTSGVFSAARIGGLVAETSYLGRAMGTSFGRNVIEGAIGSAAGEGVVAYRNEQEHQDYSAFDLMKNVAIGSFGYAGLHWLGSKAFRFVQPKVKSYLYGVSPETAAKAEATAVGQFAMDRPVDVHPIVDEARMRTSGDSIRVPGKYSNLPEYKYSPMERPDRPMYAATPDTSSNWSEGKFYTIEQDFGSGRYFTDNPIVANNHSGKEVVKGRFVQTDLKDANLINLEKPLPENLKALVEPLLKEGRVAEPDILNKSGKEVLESVRTAVSLGTLPETALDDLGQAFKQAGLDGYRHEGGQFYRSENAKHNVVMLFDHEKATPGQEFSPDPQIIPRMTEEKLTQILDEQNSFKNSILHDEQAHQDLKDIIDNPPPDLDRIALEKETQGLEDLVNGLKDQGALDEADLKVLEDLKKLAVDSQAEDEAVKMAISCVRTNI